MKLVPVIACCFVLPGSAIGKAADSLATQPFIILHGGYNSCRFVDQNHEQDNVGQELKQRFTRLRGQLQSIYTAEPKFVIGCYTVFKTNHRVGGWYIDSESPSETVPLDFHQLMERIDELQGDAATDFYIVGHSYGGWQSLHIADALARKNQSIKLLVSIDPISQRNCRPDQFIDGWIGFPHQGCLEFPRDLSIAARRVASSVEHWVNFYQTDYPFLHSQASSSAHQNFIVHTQSNSHHAHQMVSHHNGVWAYIFLWLKKIQTVAERKLYEIE